MSATHLRSKVEQLKGQRDVIQKKATEDEELIRHLEKEQVNIDQARAILREVAKQTQDQLVYHITEIVSLAMEAVFDNPYKLVMEFTDERRGKTECDIWFERDGHLMDPFDASGGTAIDIASFALLVAVWSLKSPRTRATLLIDEPFKNISEKYRLPASEMLQEISHKLGIQIIMITHSEELIAKADKIFTVRLNKKGRSKIAISS